MTAPWKPSNPGRWSMLGLPEPTDQRHHAPEYGTLAEVLAYGLVPLGAEDPVEGILEGVMLELDALGATLVTRVLSRSASEMLHLLAQRIEVAIILLQRCDNRATLPPEPDPEAEPDEEDVEVTKDAAPGEGGAA